MKRIHKVFANEVGDKIEVEVVGYGREGCARIRMAGHRCVVEEELTRIEAEQLRDALVEALS